MGILDGLHADQGIIVVELDEQDTFACAGKVVHFIDGANQRSAFACRGDHHFLAAHDRDPHHRHTFGDLGVASASARARLQERRDTDAESVAVTGCGHRIRLWPLALALCRVANHSRVERVAGDDLLAVLQLEQLLDWLTVAGGGRHVDHAAAVDRAEIREERQALAGRTRDAGQHRVALAQARGDRILDFFLTLDPAVGRQQHHVVLGDDQVLFRKFLLFADGLDQGAALAVLAELLGDGHQLLANERPATLGFLLVQEILDLLGALTLVLEFLLDHQDLEASQTVQLELQDGVGLLGVELVLGHDFLSSVGFSVRSSDDLQDRVERIEDLFEAFENVDAFVERPQLVRQTAGHHV